MVEGSGCVGATLDKTTSHYFDVEEPDDAPSQLSHLNCAKAASSSVPVNDEYAQFAMDRKLVKSLSGRQFAKTAASQTSYTGFGEESPGTTDELADPKVVFRCCDTDESGSLDSNELRFAINAFGVFPCRDTLQEWMGKKSCLNVDEFCELVNFKLQDAPESLRGPRAIPYSRRGIGFGQLAAFHRAFVESGWLQARCCAYNLQNKEDITAGSVRELQPNLYAVDRFIIRSVTTPEPNGPTVPPRLCTIAHIPIAAHKCSYSELVNPDGVCIDFFVSHWWGHPFAETIASLHCWAQQSYNKVGKCSCEEVVYWVCAMALNQHRVSEEVGSSPEEGPFNSALMQARGAIMILDENVQPFRRIWCLYEVKRLKDMNKRFELVNSTGPLTDSVHRRRGSEVSLLDPAATLAISNALENIWAFDAMASSENDKFAIWHRIADPRLRRVPLEQAKKKNMFQRSVFKRFDMSVRGILASRLFRGRMVAGDFDCAIRYIGMGAEFSSKDLDEMEAAGYDLNTTPVPVAYSESMKVTWTLLHCAAYFGLLEAIADLTSRKVDIEAATQFGVTALVHAARNDQDETVNFLLSCKANIHHRDTQGRSSLHHAAVQGSIKVVSELIVAGASVLQTAKSGETPLHAAVSGGHQEVVKLLMENQADCKATTKSGLTPLDHAARDNHVEIANFIVERCNSTELTRIVTPKIHKGRSTIELAVAAGNLEMASIFQRGISDGSEQLTDPESPAQEQTERANNVSKDEVDLTPCDATEAIPKPKVRNTKRPKRKPF